VVNLLLHFAPHTAPYSLAVLYNAFGRRLSGVGAMALPDIYEEPRHSLDATASVKLGRINLKFSAKNLLDSEERFEQSGYTIHATKPGRSFSLKLATGASEKTP
jgi:hypothetical protein